MAKITVLEQKTFQGKPSGFKVTLDDGRSGNLEEKASDKGLRVGDDVIVTEIPYTSKAGNKSTLYGLKLTNSAPASTPPPSNTPNLPPNKPAEARSSQSGTITPLDVFNAKIRINTSIFETVFEALAEGKLDDAKAMEKLTYFRTYFEGVVDDLAKGK